MHVVATNLCVWIRTLVLESIKEITKHHQKMGQFEAGILGKSISITISPKREKNLANLNKKPFREYQTALDEERRCHIGNCAQRRGASARGPINSDEVVHGPNVGREYHSRVVRPNGENYG